jgi:amino acid adenylation domain-containing protein
MNTPQSFSSVKMIDTTKLVFDDYLLEPKVADDADLAYILFTSGSTGKPKGVPITRENLTVFIQFMDELINIDETDKCLQPFDLTFDFSVSSYVIPILKGACLYTVPHNQIKFQYISELLEEYSLTLAPMVPSMIRYFQPYFDEINLPSLRYNIFCGEALPLDLVDEWSKCIPNAFIDNFYGPTENTVFTTVYRYNRSGSNKSHNGALCIGKAMPENEIVIIDDNNVPLDNNVQGELCLAGKQLTPGYWKNPGKNQEVFFMYNNTRFYRTGDVCYQDEDGDILYCGRLDSQVKVQGYRIELGEIEYHAKSFLAGYNTVCVAYETVSGNTELALFVEIVDYDTSKLAAYLKSKLPPYMVPTKLLCCHHLPLNANGKTDKNTLKEMVV